MTDKQQPKPQPEPEPRKPDELYDEKNRGLDR